MENRKDSCFETCLAHILGIRELAVPFFTKEDPEKWLTNAREWIAKRGLYSIYTTYEKGGLLTETGAPFIACGASPNSDDPANPHSHAVVMCRDEIIFDTADGIVGEPEYAIYIFAPYYRAAITATAPQPMNDCATLLEKFVGGYDAHMEGSMPNPDRFYAALRSEAFKVLVTAGIFIPTPGEQT